MTKHCLYCGLQFSDTTQFCPDCGRPTESDFIIRPTQASELEYLRRQLQEQDDLIRQLALTRTMRGETSRTAAHLTDQRRIRGTHRRRTSATVSSSGRSCIPRATLDRSTVSRRASSQLPVFLC